MSTFKPLKTLTSRRQVLKAGLAALTLSGMSQAIAKDEPLKTSNGHSKPKAKKSGGKRVVVLDPGHGGIDTGAIGRNGSKEKHVVLAIAKNVRSILRNHGIDARLTRSGDTFIPLYDRVEIAHKHGADLFMSIHADGFTNPKAAGASVFALSNRGASSAMAKYLSERENRADEVAGKKATDKDHLLQQVLFDLVQTDTIKNSLTLGSHILKKIKPVHKLHSRNTEQAAFVVLKSPSVPSVLVETSFITNPEEERLLGTAAFRQKIATAIAEGVISYFPPSMAQNLSKIVGSAKLAAAGVVGCCVMVVFSNRQASTFLTSTARRCQLPPPLIARNLPGAVSRRWAFHW